MAQVEQFQNYQTSTPGPSGDDFGMSSTVNNTGDFSYIGAPGWSNGTSLYGNVYVYYSNVTDVALLTNIQGPHLNSGFGARIDTDLSGDTLIVTAHSNIHNWNSSSCSNVYILKRLTLDWSSYTSNVIVGPSGSPVKGFGLSISIASEAPSKLCIGSPLENKVYVFDIESTPYLLYTDNPTSGHNGNTYENYANVVSSDASTISPVRLDPNKDQYGFSVSMANDGWAFIAGAPGTQSNVYTGLGLNYSVNANVSDNITNSENYWNYQSGYTKVVYAPSNWNDTINYPFALGDQQLLVGDKNRYELINFSAFGYSVAISGFLSSYFPSPGDPEEIYPTLKIAVGVPGESGFRAFRYSYLTDKWVPIGGLVLGDPGTGTTISMTYNGNRVFSGSGYNYTKTTGTHTSLNTYQIYDYNGLFWSNYSPYDSIHSDIGFTTSMSLDGLFIINSGYMSSTGDIYGNSAEFIKLSPTFKIIANTTIGGNISANDFVVGGGVRTTYPNYAGQILFSDTPGKDTSSNTIIRNWNYKNDNVTSATFNNQNTYTSSELLIHKGGEYPDKLKAWGREPDRIRVQGRSIVLDTTYSDDVNPSNTHPKFVLDTFGKIGINLPELQPESLTLRDGFGPYKENIKARLDINGRTAIRNKLDINYGNKSNVTIGKQTLVHYDTRDINCLKGIYLQDSGPREVYRSNLISTSCNYKSTEKGIYINNNGTINGVINTDIGDNTAVSFWFMLDNEHSTYNNKTIFYIGNTNTNIQEQIIACEIYYTSSSDHGIRLHFINENDKKLEFKYTFVSKKWHHIYFEREGTLQINNLQSQSTQSLPVEIM